MIPKKFIICNNFGLIFSEISINNNSFEVILYKGNKFSTEKNVRSIRPGYGLHTKYLKDIIGKIAKADIERGTALSWELIK